MCILFIEKEINSDHFGGCLFQSMLKMCQLFKYFRQYFVVVLIRDTRAFSQNWLLICDITEVWRIL